MNPNVNKIEFERITALQENRIWATELNFANTFQNKIEFDFNNLKTEHNFSNKMKRGQNRI